MGSVFANFDNWKGFTILDSLEFDIKFA